jgi:hypothetical protein
MSEPAICRCLQLSAAGLAIIGDFQLCDPNWTDFPLVAEWLKSALGRPRRQTEPSWSARSLG